MFNLRFFIFLFIFSSVLSAKYSLQLATFTSKENALKGYDRLKLDDKESVFLYKTERNYWTLRYYLSDSYSELKNLKKNSKIKIIKNSLIAKTIESKVIFKKEKNISSAFKKKISHKNKKSEIINSNNSKPKYIPMSVDDFLDPKRENQIEENIILERIKKLNKESYKISHFTFQVATSEYIFLIQFGKPPYDFYANYVFSLNSRLIENSTLTISNENGHLVFVFAHNHKNNRFEREKKIHKILRKLRHKKNVRIKMFKRH
jgi:hypothetical protein